MRVHSNAPYRNNSLKYVTEHPYRSETEFGVLRETLQSPLADRREAAHYVHDNALSTRDLEDWL